MNILTKDGLTGNSGIGVENLPGVFHISANYAAGKKHCFVLTHLRHRDGPRWKRMTLARAKKEKREIMRCSYCNRPAISIDHFWPYHSEANHCARHRNWNELCQANTEGRHGRSGPLSDATG